MAKTKTTPEGEWHQPIDPYTGKDLSEGEAAAIEAGDALPGNDGSEPPPAPDAPPVEG